VYEKYDLGKVLDLIRKELFVSAVTIQGEIIGTGIQGNPYGFTGEEKRLMVFNVIADGKRLPYTEMKAVCAGRGLETVPLIGSVALDSATTIEKFIEMSDGVSAVNAAAMREGIVYRTEDYRLSFKAVSNRYLMKRGE
jgi:ATP-dependent RNA circularization protein (DNA/RNA ligase family)